MRPEVIRRRLVKLEEYLEILRGLQRYDLDTFLEDPEHYGSAERFLQLSIETLLDMGNHVIAELELGIVDSYRHVPTILADHGYLDLDRELVHRVLQEDLSDVATLHRAFARFL